MTATLRSELRKLTSVRLFTWLAAAAVAFAIVTVVAGPPPQPALMDLSLAERDFAFIGSMWRILVALIGVRMVTDEYRYGTIVPTFVTRPERHRVVLAKGMVAAGVGALVGAVATTALVVAAAATARVDTGAAGFGADVAALVAGAAAAGALWGAIGTAVGALVRHQVAATVGTVVWLLMLEDVLRPWFGDLAGYLPSQAGTALALPVSWTVAWRGGATLAAYAIVATVAAVAVTRRRDVT